MYSQSCCFANLNLVPGKNAKLVKWHLEHHIHEAQTVNFWSFSYKNEKQGIPCLKPAALPYMDEIKDGNARRLA